MVKNTVIVPTGAKGGFVVKHPPPDGASRDAVLAEGQACYKVFIGALLSLTDNLVDGAVVPPERVVRHDGDDTYLVVAADKGTATFSDLANSVALERGFWLGDAFASGGSVGYDHKAMGITARGAWESVTRHFRELDIDVAEAGLHRRRRRRHVRRRLRQRDAAVASTSGWSPRSTTGTCSSTPRPTRRRPSPSASGCSACSAPRGPTTTARGSAPAAGSGRGRRSRSRSPGRCAPRSGWPTAWTRLTPVELIRAILLAPVDLLFNGGIGTYVKAVDRERARRRRQGQRRRAGGRRAAARPGRRRGRQPRADPARPRRVRAHRRAGEHRRDRQLRGRRHLRPRGQHQDRAEPGGRRRGARSRRPGGAARRDDRRGRGRRPQQQPRAERDAGRRGVLGAEPARRPRAVHPEPGALRAGCCAASRRCPTTGSWPSGGGTARR